MDTQWQNEGQRQTNHAQQHKIKPKHKNTHKSQIDNQWAKHSNNGKTNKPAHAQKKRRKKKAAAKRRNGQKKERKRRKSTNISISQCPKVDQCQYLKISRLAKISISQYPKVDQCLISQYLKLDQNLNISISRSRPIISQISQHPKVDQCLDISISRG